MSKTAHKIPLKLYRTMVVIDAANVAIGLRWYGQSADFRKLKLYFQKRSSSLALYYYGPQFRGDLKHQKFLAFLKSRGYILRTKSVKVIRSAGEDHRKANFDVEITIDVVDKQSKFDNLVLFSGDSDFADLILYLHKKHKKVVVISPKRNISTELLKSADIYIDLLKLSEILRPYKTPRPPKRGSGNQ